MSIHASQQETTRGISNESIANAMDQQPFSYVQNGKAIQGYYDASSNAFFGVGDRITTVIPGLFNADVSCPVAGRGGVKIADSLGAFCLNL